MIVDGSDTAVEEQADFVVVGSGAGGSACARWLAAAGHEVLIIEEGPPAAAAPGDALEAMQTLYRDGGASAAVGPDVLPLLQGCCVGGTTVINGAIQVPFPEPVWREWVEADARWAQWLPWSELEAARERMDRELSVAPTPEGLWGGNGGSLKRGLGEAAHPTRRNAPGCQGSGRCLQGCPHAAKTSSDRELIPRAIEDGARVYARCQARSVRIRRGRAEAVEGRFSSGARFTATARRAVVLAAGAIHTPWLLLRSGVRSAGRGFQCHPGAGVSGLFPSSLCATPEATQSMESLAWLDQGVKFESLGMPQAFRAARVPGVGAVLQRRLEQLDRVAIWGVACRAEARGRIRRTPLGPLVFYAPTRADRQRTLLGLSILAEAMIEAGATEVWPSAHGAPETIHTVDEARAIRDLDPAPGAIPMAATHLFGGAPVRERFQVEGVDRLVVADASLFPSNIGVNPHSAIASVATVVADRWV